MLLQLGCFDQVVAVGAVCEHFAFVFDVVLDDSWLLEVRIFFLAVWAHIDDGELSVGSRNNRNGLTFEQRSLLVAVLV